MKKRTNKANISHKFLNIKERDYFIVTANI